MFFHAPGLGYWPDPHDARDLPFEFLSAQSIPAEKSLEDRCVPIPNQLNSSSCVGQAVRQGFGVEEARVTSAPADPVAAAGIYFNSRAEHGVEAYDMGTFNRTAIKSLVRFGPLREKDWPFDVAKINKRPSWRAYRNAHDDKGPHGYYRITEVGDNRLDAIRRAIAAEHPVVFGTKVAQSFMSDSGGSRINRPSSSDPIVGGHSMCAVGYQNDLFRVANSWGTGWRDRGFAWLHESYMSWEYTGDLWVIVL